MCYLENFGVLTRVGVDVFKFFGVGVFKQKAGAESESKNCNSAHLCRIPLLHCSYSTKHLLNLMFLRLRTTLTQW